MKQYILLIIIITLFVNCSVLTEKYVHDVCISIEDGKNVILKNIRVKDSIKASLSGNIKVKETQTPLHNASIALTDINSKKIYGEITNEIGDYSIEVPKSSYELEIFYLGYVTHKDTIDINKNETLILDIALADAGGYYSSTIKSKTKISQKKAEEIARKANQKQ